jgi:hypothetical protein
LLLLLLLLLPLHSFHQSELQMGTQKESFIELTERIGRKTGGISVYPFSSAKRGQELPVAYLMVRYLKSSSIIICDWLPLLVTYSVSLLVSCLGVAPGSRWPTSWCAI